MLRIARFETETTIVRVGLTELGCACLLLSNRFADVFRRRYQDISFLVNSVEGLYLTRTVS